MDARFNFQGNTVAAKFGLAGRDGGAGEDPG